jgi:DNA-binding response OmpR family regulator
VAALRTVRPARVRKRILVIEDDVDLVELLRFKLTQAGFLTLAAADGADGLEKVRTLRPDLILLDLMLPELDGFALCEILRRDRSTRTVPIIILSAMSGELARVAGLGAGANDFLSKPFSLKVLIYRIQTILGENQKAELGQPTGASE